MDRPLLLIDVDGVISLFGFELSRAPAGRFELVAGTAHSLSGTAGEHLRAPLPHLVFDPVTRGGERAHWKLSSIERYAGPHRALAWIDDAHDEHCAARALSRSAPTLLIGTQSATGLTGAHVSELLDWARADRARGQPAPVD